MKDAHASNDTLYIQLFLRLLTVLIKWLVCPVVRHLQPTRVTNWTVFCCVWHYAVNYQPYRFPKRFGLCDVCVFLWFGLINVCSLLWNGFSYVEWVALDTLVNSEHHHICGKLWLLTQQKIRHEWTMPQAGVVTPPIPLCTYMTIVCETCAAQFMIMNIIMQQRVHFLFGTCNKYFTRKRGVSGW